MAINRLKKGSKGRPGWSDHGRRRAIMKRWDDLQHSLQFLFLSLNKLNEKKIKRNIEPNYLFF